MNYHVVGIDLSLSRTGVAVFRGDDPGDPGQQKPTVSSIESHPKKSGTDRKTGKPAATLLDTQQRIRRLAGRIVTTAMGGWTEADGAPLFVVEQMFPTAERGVFDRGWLRGFVLDALVQRGFVVEVANTALKRYATGSGGTPRGANPKAGVLLAVSRMYPAAFITDDNEADAAVLGGMGCRALGFPREPSVQRAHPAALDSVDWPSDTASRSSRANPTE